MHDGDLAAAIAQVAHEVPQRFEIALIELRHAALHFPLRGAHHADAHFDRDRHAHRRAHCGHTLRNPRALEHQAGAEAATHHAVARTTAAEVDLVVAGLLVVARRPPALATLS